MIKLMLALLMLIGAVVLVYFALALGLVFSQRPIDLSDMDSISFDGVMAQPQDMAEALPLASVEARNGAVVRYRHFPAFSDAAPLAIVVHGSGWHGGAYLTIARALAETGGFEVLVPDLRGHGASPNRRGDVDYIGQFEDDLATLIKAHGGKARRVVMVGHSSGGGLVIRFAGGMHGSLLDRAILIAPYLHHSAPTFRETAGGWAHPLVRRIIGLSMLNAVRVTGLNGLTVIQFNYPEIVLAGPQGHTATKAYSYRLNESFNPRDSYLSDIARLPEFLLIAGLDDDAFFADQYEPTMAAASDRGSYTLLPQADHIGIVTDPRAVELIVNFSQRPFQTGAQTEPRP